MARHALAALALLVSLALLHQASGARVLQQDAAAPAPAAAEPEEIIADPGPGGIIGFVRVENQCDMSVEGAWQSEECLLVDDGSKPRHIALGASALQQYALFKTRCAVQPTALA
jgi:hypothetical protein